MAGVLSPNGKLRIVPGDRVRNGLAPQERGGALLSKLVATGQQDWRLVQSPQEDAHLSDLTCEVHSLRARADYADYCRKTDLYYEAPEAAFESQLEAALAELSS